MTPTKGSLTRPMFYEAVLPNGMKIAAQKLPHFRSVSLGVWVGTGTVKERPSEAGISHFIEHMLFKGTHSRTAAGIAAEMDRIGAVLNAFTSKECTCYYAKATGEHLNDIAEILSDMVEHSAFDPAEMEKEKSVVVEEINMSEDTPEDVVMELLSAAYFAGSALAHPILGTRESVRSFAREDLLDYTRRHYSPENMLLAAAGNFEEEELYACAQRWFGAETTPIPPVEYPRSQPAGGVRTAFAQKDIEQCHLALALPGLCPLDAGYYPMLVLNNALGGSMSSRLFQHIREERGLAYSVYSFNSSYRSCGTLGFYAGTGASQGGTVLKLMLDELCDVRAHGLTEEEFVRSRDQLKGSYALANESTGARMNAIGKSKLLYDALRTEEEVTAAIEAVTFEEANAAAKALLDPAQMTAAFVARSEGIEEEARALLGG